MATLIVTFSKIDARLNFNPPIARGADCRTETVTMPGESGAASGEQAVELTADADCWVGIGADPDATIATDGTGSARFIKADIPYSFSVSDGDKVAVVAA